MSNEKEFDNEAEKIEKKLLKSIEDILSESKNEKILLPLNYVLGRIYASSMATAVIAGMFPNEKIDDVLKTIKKSIDRNINDNEVIKNALLDFIDHQYKKNEEEN